MGTEQVGADSDVSGDEAVVPEHATGVEAGSGGGATEEDHGVRGVAGDREAGAGDGEGGSKGGTGDRQNADGSDGLHHWKISPLRV